MLSNYKVYKLDYAAETGKWIPVENASYFLCYITFYIYEHRTFVIERKIRKKRFKGMVSVFKFENIEIKIPQNKFIINIVDELFYENYKVNIHLLFLLSFSKKKYLLIPENIFIKFQYYLNFYDMNYPIFNSKYYVMKNKLFLNFTQLNNFDIIQVIYRLIFANKSNKFHVDEVRISLIKNLCDRIGIKYKNISNGIELFIITNLEYKKDIYYEGDMYYLDNEDLLIFTKIGKYVLFI